MISNVTCDTSGLENMISGLRGVLFGTGAGAGDCGRLLSAEAGHTLAQIGDSLGPSSKAKGEKFINRSIKGFMAADFSYSTFTRTSQHQSSSGNIHWLTAGPQWLAGVQVEDSKERAVSDEAIRVLRTEQKKGSRGNKWIFLGDRIAHRGRGTKRVAYNVQGVKRLNRVLIPQQTLRAMRAQLAERVGELRAVFYRVAVRYVPGRRVPSWIRPKFGAVEAKGKSELTRESLAGPEALIEFIARAPGVAANAVIAQKVQDAIAARSRIIRSKLKKILAGYKYEWETGRVFLPKTEVINDP